MDYYRKDKTIGAARDSVEQAAYLAAGFTLIDAAHTIPGNVYTIGGPDMRVDPRAWDRDTGLRATRRAEFCPACGQWLQTPGGCLCKQPKPERPPVVTTHPSRCHKRDSRGRAIVADIVCGPRCKRYFVAHGAVGAATSPDAYLAYHRAGWARAGHGTTLGIVHDVVDDMRYTVGGPDRDCTREEFLRILRGRAQVTDSAGR
jgi:hypothetical protein